MSNYNSQNDSRAYICPVFSLFICTFLIVTTANAGYVVNSDKNNDFNEAHKTIGQYRDNIYEIEMARGPHDVAIVENLISLSYIYKDEGEHIKRLEVLKQALHIHRLNYGLESKEQLGIIEQLISTNNDIEDWVALDKNYEYFYWVHRRVHGTNSLDLLPALNRIMEWKLDVLRRGLFGHPTIINHQATDLLRKIRKIKKINTEKSSYFSISNRCLN